MNKKLDAKQSIQEEQYDFPYHYIPVIKNDLCYQHQNWEWGFKYAVGLLATKSILGKIPFNSLIDIGCGDGRFLHECKNWFPSKTTLGVDYSEKAIKLAKALNPTINFTACDITKTKPSKRYDALTLIEVIEHIPPDDLPSFLKSCAQRITNDGHIIITVPHTNSPLSPKHYQHFNSEKLRKYIEPHFEVIDFIPFDIRRRSLSLFKRALGGDANQFIIANKFLNRLYFKLYMKYSLFGESEKSCYRIACIAKPKHQEVAQQGAPSQ